MFCVSPGCFLDVFHIFHVLVFSVPEVDSRPSLLMCTAPSGSIGFFCAHLCVLDYAQFLSDTVDGFCSSEGLVPCIWQSLARCFFRRSPEKYFVSGFRWEMTSGPVSAGYKFASVCEGFGLSHATLVVCVTCSVEWTSSTWHTARYESCWYSSHRLPGIYVHISAYWTSSNSLSDSRRLSLRRRWFLRCPCEVRVRIVLLVSCSLVVLRWLP